MKTFEEFLKEKFAKENCGKYDEQVFKYWLRHLLLNEILAFAQEWGNKMVNKIVDDLEKIMDNSI